MVSKDQNGDTCKANFGASKWVDYKPMGDGFTEWVESGYVVFNYGCQVLAKLVSGKDYVFFTNTSIIWVKSINISTYDEGKHSLGSWLKFIYLKKKI